MLKHAFGLIFCLGIFGNTFSQNYKRAIPPFKIRLVNGNGFTYEQVNRHKSLVLVYFSPTCEHCKEFTTALLKRKNELIGRQIIFISFEDLKEMKDFDNLFHLSSIANISIGSEGYTFIVQKYYQIQKFPFVAVFNKKGILVKVISEKLAPEQMAKQI